VSALEPGAVTDAAALVLAHEPLGSGEVVDGAPTTGSVALGEIRGVEVGVWEMTPGTASDVEADELFVVLSGAASIRFVSPELPTIEVGPGSVVRLSEGMRTVWTVAETLRKVYIA